MALAGREVAVVGGGPGGLFVARLLRLREPRLRVVVYERNPPDATFGFGVVFSERTLGALRGADPAIHDRIVDASQHWTDMELRVDGTVLRYGGFGFTAIARTTLLRILQEGAAEAGAQLEFETEVRLDQVADADVVVASDGVNSSIRRQLAAELSASEEPGAAKYAWFGTTARFDAVTFPFVETQHGRFAAHAYPYDEQRSTFIVEADEATWRHAGMEEWTAAAHAPGHSDLRSSAYLERAFADHLDGRPLLVNNSKWANFVVVRNARWHHGNVVLVGDAAHTAHFSVGSGTKMAMEDSIALADALARHAELAEAFAAYEDTRRPAVARTQRWAEPSQRWWETFGRRRFDDPEQLAFHFITRTGAMSYHGLRRRAADRVEAAERSFLTAAGVLTAESTLRAPLRIGRSTAANRLALPLTKPGAANAELVDAYSRSGVGMIIAPAATVRRAIAAGSCDGALLCAQVAATDPEGIQAAAAAGADVIEVAGDGTVAPTVGELVAAADGVPLLVAWRAPLDDPWRAKGWEMVRCAEQLVNAGVLGVRLVPTDLREDREGALRPHPALPGLALADRIKTETGALLALTVPAGWVTARPPTEPVDDWSTQAHMALVAGRIDLLATWPLPGCAGIGGLA